MGEAVRSFGIYNGEGKRKATFMWGWGRELWPAWQPRKAVALVRRTVNAALVLAFQHCVIHINTPQLRPRQSCPSFFARYTDCHERPRNTSLTVADRANTNHDTAQQAPAGHQPHTPPSQR